MRHPDRHDGAAAGRRRRAAALALLVAAPIVFAGCHDEERLRQRLEGPPARLPVEPDQPKVPPAPALLDTIGVWVPPKLYPASVTNTWPVSTLKATDDFNVTYRVPDSWRGLEDEDGESRNRRHTVEAQALLTELDDSDISLATYAAQLADGAPIYQYTTEDGHIVYLMRREVSLAPSDPEAPREVFHTAVVSLDGRIAKLDLRFDADLAWQFDELASAITGTVQVRRRSS
jgi:hypothetical protein